MTNSDGQSMKLDGRIVWKSGDLFKGRVKTIFGTKTPLVDAQGKQQIEYGFGLAVPKVLPNGQPNPQLQHAQTVMQAEALKIYPNGQVPPIFAWKITDGDGVDQRTGAPLSKEGYKGCMIFALSTRMTVPFYKNVNGAFVLIQDGVKSGDYVRVNLNIKAHGAVGQGKPGMYVNPTGVLLTGIGEEIMSAGGFNPEDAFGGEEIQTPFGAQPVQAATTFGFGNQVQAPQQPQAVVQPHHGILPQAPQAGGFPQAGQTNFPFPMK